MPGPPAFQFYPQDFLMGTLTLSNEVVGAYIRLLCHQWDMGGIPDNEDQIVAILRTHRRVARRIWKTLTEVSPKLARSLPEVSPRFDRSLPEVSPKFYLDGDGLWRNKRLEDVRRKQQAFNALQASKGKKGGLATQGRIKPVLKPGRLKPKSSSSYFNLQSSLRTYKNAAAPPTPPVETVETVEKLAHPVEKSAGERPKHVTLTALMREELLSRIDGVQDNGDLIELGKYLAARYHLRYTGSAIERAIASARAQIAKRGN